MCRFISSVALGAALFSGLTTSAFAADYGAKGPEATTTSDLPRNQGGASGGKLVVPKGPGPYPLIVTSHGFSANASNQLGWATHFASYGFVVVVPSFPGGLSPNHTKNAQVIEALVSLYTNPSTSSPAKGKVDPSRIGLEGHSAGGLATTIAASRLKPSAIVLFDPVDANDLGRTAMGSVCSPTLSVFAPPSSCNSSGNWTPFKDTSVGPRVNFRVLNSTHCDGENAPRGLCGLFCGGGANKTRQSIYASYATAHFLAHLKGDATAAAELTEAALTKRRDIESVIVGSAASCATGPTITPLSEIAATESATAEPASAAAASERESALTTDEGAPLEDDVARVENAESNGCSAAPRGATTGALAAFGFAAVGLALGRRRRR